MLTTKTMMMNWMKKTTYVVVVVVVVYSHSYAHKYQHFCENSMEIRAAHIDIIYVYTLLYTLHISARTHTHTTEQYNIIESIHMRKEISQKCNVCHVIDFYNVWNCKCISRAHSDVDDDGAEEAQGWKFQFELNPSAVKAFDITTNTMAQRARIHAPGQFGSR